MDGPGGVTLEAINELGLKIRSMRDAKDQLKKHLEELNGNLREAECQFLAYLQENQMDKYSIPGYGTAYITKRLSYKVPKTEGERLAFFTHLKSKGIFDDMITVHSQTLNSWAKKELEIAKESGCSEFEIPGLGDPTYSETLGVRKS